MMEGTETRVMGKVWSQVAISEERIILLKNLIKIGVGVAEVEELGANIHSKFKSNSFLSRVNDGEIVSKEAIKQIMILKLRDERKHLRDLMRKKKMLREKIEKDMKKNSRPSRRLLQEFRNQSAKVRIEHREKYRQKVEHLKRKYRDSKEELSRKIPEDLTALGGLRIFDPSRYEEIEKEEYDIKIIGDVEINEKELQVLKLHPKFAIPQRLHRGGLDVEEELANSKLRMTVSKELEEKKKAKEHPRVQLVEEITSADDKIEEIEMEAKTRQVFNPIEKEYDERKRRVTDLRECTRVTLPKPLPAAEEAKIELRRNIHTEIFEKFREENCKKTGEQKNNLTKDEQDGLKSLEKKIKDRKVIVIKTDKSSRFAVCSEEAYLRMGRVHTTKDKSISREKLIEVEKLLNNHCVAWGKMWGSGDNHDHRSRIVNSKKTCSENTADMYILLKDHKEGEKTRPIVTGCTSNTLGMSNNVASVLEAIAASEESPFESISSEDMLAKFKQFNNKVLERREKRKNENIDDKKDDEPVEEVEKEDEKLRDKIPCGLLRGLTPETVCQTFQEPAEEVGRSSPRGIARGDTPGLSNQVLEIKNPLERLGERSLDGTGAYDEISRIDHEEVISGESSAPSNAGPPAYPEDETSSSRRNEDIKNMDYDEEDHCIIGCDVVALFPSLTSKKTGEIIRERIIKSKLSFKGFDYQQGRR